MTLSLRTHAKRVARALLDRSLPTRAWLETPVPRSDAVHLTFDDGPDPRHTPAVLDALEELGAHATFFVVGARAAAYPELVRRIAASGHGLGHHSYRHLDPAQLTAADLVRELVATDELLRKVTGTGARLYRPPHGRLTIATLVGAWSVGKRVALWSRDPRDYRARDAAEVVARIHLESLRAGDVVLLHDVNPRAADVTRAIGTSLRERGLRCARLPGSLVAHSTYA